MLCDFIPAYLFASAGFDVWLMNTRGGPFGSKHRHLDSEKNRIKFYDFSLLEIGSFDYSAQIDYAISATNYSQVFREFYTIFRADRPRFCFISLAVQVFVAVVSQSTAAMLALLAKRPLYNTKIRAMVSFGGLRGGCFVPCRTADVIQFMVWPSVRIFNESYLNAIEFDFSTFPFNEDRIRTLSCLGIRHMTIFGSTSILRVSRINFPLLAGSNCLVEFFRALPRGRSASGERHLHSNRRFLRRLTTGRVVYDLCRILEQSE